MADAKPAPPPGPSVTVTKKTEDDFATDLRALSARLNRGLLGQTPGKTIIGTCTTCGADIFGRRKKGARFCSGKCRTAAYRKRKPSPNVSALRESLEWTQAGETALREENARLKAEIDRLKAASAPSSVEQQLAADARRAKLERAEERARRISRRYRQDQHRAGAARGAVPRKTSGRTKDAP